jgi:hypothetical protein
VENLKLETLVIFWIGFSIVAFATGNYVGLIVGFAIMLPLIIVYTVIGCIVDGFKQRNRTRARASLGGHPAG